MRKGISETMKPLVFTAVVVCALIPRGAQAQVATTLTMPRAWNPVPGYLGIENLRCDCTLSLGARGRPRSFTFRSEPIVMGIAEGSPGDGLLESGDVITHIGGYPLLGREGAQRFASIEPGDEVQLTIRRDGRSMHVSLRAEEPRLRRMYGLIAPSATAGRGEIWSTPPAEPAIPPEPAIPAMPAPQVWATPAPLALPATPSIPAAPAIAWTVPPDVPESPASPRAWYGFSIRCTQCGWYSSGRPGADPVWESTEPPEVSMVSPESPAGRAGLRAGDRIIAIDGLSILSREGSRRFGSVEPGQRIRLTVRRGNGTMVKEMRLTRRPEAMAAIAAIAAVAATPPRAPVAPAMRRELRYTGQVDNVSVQVWSVGGPTVERVGDTMVITVGASVVRIKVGPKK